jgi:hypothetical protein
MILRVAGREKEGYLGDEQIQEFPGQFLRQIDTIWDNYSNGKFGFRVQKHLMRECKKDPQAFGDRVGWRNEDGWISASRVIYNPIDAPKGHLPWGMLQVITMDKEERNLEYELSFEEAWWYGQIIEALKVRKLFSFLVSCDEF